MWLYLRLHGLEEDRDGFNFLAMWDLHYLREIDDSGCIDGVWGN